MIIQHYLFPPRLNHQLPTHRLQTQEDGFHLDAEKRVTNKQQKNAGHGVVEERQRGAMSRGKEGFRS